MPRTAKSPDDLKLIVASYPDFRIDGHPKMSWNHSLVGVSHIAEFHEKQLATVRKMRINLPKMPCTEQC